MKQTTITFNLDGLDDMKKAIGGSYRARIGILGGKGSAIHKGSGLSNAELGLIQMFGSVAAGIVSRDFLLMPIQYNQQDLLKTISGGYIKAAFERGDYKQVFKLIGIKCEEYVQKAFETGGFGLWQPLKPATIKAKGSSAILIRFGELRRSISSTVVNGSSS